MMPSHHRSRQPSPQAIERLYGLPNENRSIDDWYRLRHRDLPAMSDHELDRERTRVRLRAAYEPDRFRLRWLEDRQAAIAAEPRRQRVAPRSAAAARYA